MFSGAEIYLRLIFCVVLVPDKGTGRFVDLYQPFVHQGHLDCWRSYLPQATQGGIKANSIILVEVDYGKILGQCFDDLHVAPVFFIDPSKVHFHDNLVNVFKLFDGEILESFVLASLDIYFENPVFPSEVVSFDHIIQGNKGELL